MRLLRAALVVILLGAAFVPLQAAGSVVVTDKEVSAGLSASGGFIFRQYTVAWTSDAADGSVAANVSGNGFAIRSGYLESIRFIPGSTAPTNLYDVTLTDSDGTIASGDLLSGTGADRSSTLSSVLTFDPPIFMDGTRTLAVVVANAGNSKTGRVVILVRTR
jgi:hypothetical protein